MGRTKQFDIDEALTRAMYVFWEKGYDETSVSDLLEAMDILNGSFYNTFGDKKRLFVQVLDKYNSDVTGKVLQAMATDRSASDSIRSYFKIIYASFKSEEIPHGCLVANCLNTETMKDPDLRKVIEGRLKLFINVFQKKIQESIDDGTLKTSYSAKDLATLIFSHIQGISKTHDLGVPLTTLQRQTDIFLESLGL